MLSDTSRPELEMAKVVALCLLCIKLPYVCEPYSKLVYCGANKLVQQEYAASAFKHMLAVCKDCI